MYNITSPPRRYPRQAPEVQARDLPFSASPGHYPGPLISALHLCTSPPLLALLSSPLHQVLGQLIWTLPALVDIDPFLPPLYSGFIGLIPWGCALASPHFLRHRQRSHIEALQLLIFNAVKLGRTLSPPLQHPSLTVALLFCCASSPVSRH